MQSSFQTSREKSSNPDIISAFSVTMLYYRPGRFVQWFYNFFSQAAISLGNVSECINVIAEIFSAQEYGLLIQTSLVVIRPITKHNNALQSPNKPCCC